MMMTSSEQLASLILSPEKWDIRISNLKCVVTVDGEEIAYTISTCRTKGPSEDFYRGEVINSRNGLSVVWSGEIS